MAIAVVAAKAEFLSGLTIVIIVSRIGIIHWFSAAGYDEFRLQKCVTGMKLM